MGIFVQGEGKEGEGVSENKAEKLTLKILSILSENPELKQDLELMGRIKLLPEKETGKVRRVIDEYFDVKPKGKVAQPNVFGLSKLKEHYKIKDLDVPEIPKNILDKIGILKAEKKPDDSTNDEFK